MNNQIVSNVHYDSKFDVLRYIFPSEKSIEHSIDTTYGEHITDNIFFMKDKLKGKNIGITTIGFLKLYKSKRKELDILKTYFDIDEMALYSLQIKYKLKMPQKKETSNEIQSKQRYELIQVKKNSIKKISTCLRSVGNYSLYYTMDPMTGNHMYKIIKDCMVFKRGKKVTKGSLQFKSKDINMAIDKFNELIMNQYIDIL